MANGASSLPRTCSQSFMLFGFCFFAILAILQPHQPCHSTHGRAEGLGCGRGRWIFCLNFCRTSVSASLCSCRAANVLRSSLCLCVAPDGTSVGLRESFDNFVDGSVPRFPSVASLLPLVQQMKCFYMKTKRWDRKGA